MLLGCGGGPVEKKFTSEELDQLARNNRKKIADDKTLTDDAAIKKYCEMHPHKPTILVGKNQPWLEIKPLSPGKSEYIVSIVKYDFSFMGRTNKDADMLKLERDSIKAAAEFCEEIMTALQSRGLKGISYHYYASVSNESPEFEVFRATITDASKFAAARGKADPGTVFDPRSPKINEIWKVEKNIYPQIEYKKKS